MTKNRHIGSSFDDFLETEGIRAEAEAAALKRVIAWQISRAMKQDRVTKIQMAERMRTSRSALDRLLDPDDKSVTLDTISRAAVTLGKRVQFSLVDAEAERRGGDGHARVRVRSAALRRRARG
jgi:hypothetical protein